MRVCCLPFAASSNMGGIHFCDHNLHQWEEIDRFMAL